MANGFVGKRPREQTVLATVTAVSFGMMKEGREARNGAFLYLNRPGKIIIVEIKEF